MDNLLVCSPEFSQKKFCFHSSLCLLYFSVAATLWETTQVSKQAELSPQPRITYKQLTVQLFLFLNSTGFPPQCGFGPPIEASAELKHLRSQNSNERIKTIFNSSELRAEETLHKSRNSLNAIPWRDYPTCLMNREISGANIRSLHNQHGSLSTQTALKSESWAR